MSSKNMNNYYNDNAGYDENVEYENNYYNNVDNQDNNNYYNNNNYNYAGQYNNYYQNNYNYYNNNNYNNPYGNIVNYYNNYPVYASIPASGAYANNQEESNEVNNEQAYMKKPSKESSNLIGKTSLKSKKSKGGIVLTYKKQDICHARPPQYAPGFIGMAPGKPAYAMKPPQSNN